MDSSLSNFIHHPLYVYGVFPFFSVIHQLEKETFRMSEQQPNGFSLYEA